MGSWPFANKRCARLPTEFVLWDIQVGIVDCSAIAPAEARLSPVPSRPHGVYSAIPAGRAEAPQHGPPTRPAPFLSAWEGPNRIHSGFQQAGAIFCSSDPTDRRQTPLPPRSPRCRLPACRMATAALRQAMHSHACGPASLSRSRSYMPGEPPLLPRGAQPLSSTSPHCHCRRCALVSSCSSPAISVTRGSMYRCGYTVPPVGSTKPHEAVFLRYWP